MCLAGPSSVQTLLSVRVLLSLDGNRSRLLLVEHFTSSNAWHSIPSNRQGLGDTELTLPEDAPLNQVVCALSLYMGYINRPLPAGQDLITPNSKGKGEAQSL